MRLDICGSIDYFSLDKNGMISEGVELSSPDGNVSISIPAGIALLDEGSKPLRNLTVTPVEPLPAPPEGYHVLAAFDFEPDGASFNPGLHITFTYDPAAIPEGMDENKLVVAVFDGDSGEWKFLSAFIDPETNTAKFTATHFTMYAVIVPPPPTPTPTVLATVTPAVKFAAPSSGGGLGTGPMIGIIAGAVAVAALVVAIWLMRKRQFSIVEWLKFDVKWWFQDLGKNLTSFKR
jgi:hypothetical protein